MKKKEAAFSFVYLVKNGYRMRDFKGLPIGGRSVIIRMKVQRYKCKDCEYDRQERIPFATESQRTPTVLPGMLWLVMNEPLSKAHCLKEQPRKIWNYYYPVNF
jgi:hypothetical protein